MVAEVEVAVAEASIHHLLQAVETVPLWLVPVVVVVALLLRQEVEERKRAAQTDHAEAPKKAEVPEQLVVSAQTDHAEVPKKAEVPEQLVVPERKGQLGVLRQVEVAWMVLSMAKWNEVND